MHKKCATASFTNKRVSPLLLLLVKNVVRRRGEPTNSENHLKSTGQQSFGIRINVLVPKTVMPYNNRSKEKAKTEKTSYLREKGRKRIEKRIKNVLISHRRLVD